MDVLVPLGQTRKPENSVLAKIMTTCRLPTDTHLLAYTRARRKLRFSSPLSVFSQGHEFSKPCTFSFVFRLPQLTERGLFLTPTGLLSLQSAPRCCLWYSLLPSTAMYAV
jgi:hypothetical protein